MGCTTLARRAHGIHPPRQRQFLRERLDPEQQRMGCIERRSDCRIPRHARRRDQLPLCRSAISERWCGERTPQPGSGTFTEWPFALHPSTKRTGAPVQEIEKTKKAILVKLNVELDLGLNIKEFESISFAQIEEIFLTHAIPNYWTAFIGYEKELQNISFEHSIFSMGRQGVEDNVRRFDVFFPIGCQIVQLKFANHIVKDIHENNGKLVVKFIQLLSQTKKYYDYAMKAPKDYPDVLGPECYGLFVINVCKDSHAGAEHASMSSTKCQKEHT